MTGPREVEKAYVRYLLYVVLSIVLDDHYCSDSTLCMSEVTVTLMHGVLECPRCQRNANGILSRGRLLRAAVTRRAFEAKCVTTVVTAWVRQPNLGLSLHSLFFRNSYLLNVFFLGLISTSVMVQTMSCHRPITDALELEGDDPIVQTKPCKLV